jgi:hypothetical protein
MTTVTAAAADAPATPAGWSATGDPPPRRGGARPSAVSACAAARVSRLQPETGRWHDDGTRGTAFACERCSWLSVIFRLCRPRFPRLRAVLAERATLGLAALWRGAREERVRLLLPREPGGCGKGTRTELKSNIN